MDIIYNIPPLSVNQCWKGRRFKTKQYLAYEQELLLTLPIQQLPEPPYKIYFEFGFSNFNSDWDNPIKPLQDIISKKYGFNDKNIHEGSAKKIKVKKGEEYILVRLESIN